MATVRVEPPPWTGVPTRALDSLVFSAMEELDLERGLTGILQDFSLWGDHNAILPDRPSLLVQDMRLQTPDLTCSPSRVSIWWLQVEEWRNSRWIQFGLAAIHPWPTRSNCYGKLMLSRLCTTWPCRGSWINVCRGMLSFSILPSPDTKS